MLLAFHPEYSSVKGFMTAGALILKQKLLDNALSHTLVSRDF